jgi:hypothetical protein
MSASFASKMTTCSKELLSGIHKYVFSSDLGEMFGANRIYTKYKKNTKVLKQNALN